MKGSAFIIHNDTWSCSNQVVLDFFSEPIFGENNEIVSLKQTQVLNIFHIFHAANPLVADDKCQMAIISEDGKIKQGFNGEVKLISPLKVIINIFCKNDNLSEILSNITFKN